MNLKIFFCWSLIFLMNYSAAVSQVKDTVQTKDTLQTKGVLPKEHKKNTFRPTTDFDQRFSFFRNSKVNIWGQKVGVLVNEKFKVGIGGYFLKDKLKGSKLYNSSTPDFYVNRDLQFA